MNTPHSELPLEIPVESVQEILREGMEFLLLDCRTSEEWQLARIEEATFVPMQELPARLDELESYRESSVVVHCHHGARSLQVAQWLRHQGFLAAQSMAGGIDAWSTRIDATVPRY